MIVTRTPLRISFAGGGTDMAAYYEQDDGVVLSTTITQYVYVTVKRHSNLFDEPIRVNYKVSEEVQSVDEIENNIVRECLRLLDVGPPIYISMVGDVPASTGLGGSSALTVGLLNALHAVKGERVSAGQLAEEACHIEIDVLSEPIGKQDQYAAAFGGLNVFTFRSDGTVSVRPKNLALPVRNKLFESLILFWTGNVRDARAVLAEQRANVEIERGRLRKMSDQVVELETVLGTDLLDLAAFGRVLDEGWRLKRGLASGISSGAIDDLYEGAIAAGALGGRLCGAGGGGFLLFVAPPDRRDAIRQALTGLTELPVAHEVHGSHVVVPFDQ
ncbi:MAG: GHMP kinase [Acidimicrobiales bacterium]|jgi:D-glycero-alpha-D-manno-heptose-7-phosphate kinase